MTNATAVSQESSPWIKRDRVFDFLAPVVTPEANLGKSTLLYMEGINKAFNGFKAINQLNLYVEKGELRCVIGPNGAGKTTIMDIITGKTRPDSGVAWFGHSIDLTRLSESAIANAGIGRKFQKPTVFEQLSVLNNLELAMASDRRVRWTLRCKLTPSDIERIEQVAETVGLTASLNTPAGTLSHGKKQWLEIGMLLIQRPLLLLIDEPVAGMTHQEMEKTGELLKELANEHTIIVVEHDMEFIRSLNTKTTVLHQGTVLAEGSMAEIQNNPEVRRVYLGE